MHTRISPHTAALPESGVSEVLGVVFLLGIVMVAVAIVAAILFSQTTPQEIPNVNFMTGSDSGNHLYLFHNGGDSLAKGSFYILVDGARRDDYAISDGSSTWSLGKNLILDKVASTSLHTVAVIYNQSGGSGGAIVLRSVNTSNLPIINNTVSPDVITSSYPPLISVPQLMQNITGASINYYREGGTILQSGNGYIQFNVTKINSSIWYSTSPSSAATFYPLNIGSQIKIIPNTSTSYTIISPNVRIFGIGDQLWELTVSNATVTVTNQSGTQDVVNLNSGTKVLITHAWITGYKDFKSTLGLTTTSTPGTYYTELVMNNYTSYASSQNFIQVLNNSASKIIVINNIQPTGTGLFLLQYDVKTSGNSTYFVGNGTYSVT